MRQRCWDAGLATLPCGPRSLRFRPPLIFSEKEMREAVNVLRVVLERWEEKTAGEPGPGRETPG